jgi:DNA topoisomerase-1
MDDPIGDWNGHPVFVKTGRYGPYVQWGTMDEPPADMEKPRMESLLSTMSVETVTLDDALKLLSLPRQVGADPADGEPILVRNGRYGPYVQKGTESRSLDGEDQLFTLTLEEALAKLAQPRTYGRRGPAKPPLKEFGTDPVSGKPVVAKDGRFGTYVTDGDTNASLTRGDRLEFMTAERAFELLAIRREAEPSTKKKVGARKAAAPRAAAKKSAAKKAAPGKKAPAKKAAAKKTATATKTGAARAAAAATDASDQPA